MQAQIPLDKINKVTISPQGIFKYILITGQMTINNNKQQLCYVRGSDKRQYHQQNLQDFIQEFKSAGFIIKKRDMNKGTFMVEYNNVRISFKCPGGGRIQHNYKGNKCFIYGYSKSYGKVDHKIAQQLISSSLGYPINQITTSQEGY